MKKLITTYVFLMLFLSLKSYAFDYTITFTGTEANTTVESVIVQNLTKADTAIKGEAKKNMIDTVLKVAAGMAAHAASTGDTRLKMIAAVSHSKLDDMRETDFVNQVRTIYDAALPVAAGLAEWGVTQSDIDALDTNSGEYMSKSPTIRNVKVKAKQATSDLKANFDEANALIKTKLDAMMLPFKTLNSSFHGEYLNARVIIDLAGGHATTPVDTKPVE